ncbi:MAG TPA: hypothetical protein VFL79_20220 [Terriglobia bacterium]|nr:hypothetical protein [Terriglobia bacterium]
MKSGPALAMLMPGAEINDSNIITFMFTCKALSDGSEKAVSVRCRISAGGEVSVCDYEVAADPAPGMEQDSAMLFPDDSGMDDEADAPFYLANFRGRTQ